VLIVLILGASVVGCLALRRFCPNTHARAHTHTHSQDPSTSSGAAHDKMQQATNDEAWEIEVYERNMARALVQSAAHPQPPRKLLSEALSCSQSSFPSVQGSGHTHPSAVHYNIGTPPGPPPTNEPEVDIHPAVSDNSPYSERGWPTFESQVARLGGALKTVTDIQPAPSTNGKVFGTDWLCPNGRCPNGHELFKFDAVVLSSVCNKTMDHTCCGCGEDLCNSLTATFLYCPDCRHLSCSPECAAGNAVCPHGHDMSWICVGQDAPRYASGSVTVCNACNNQRESKTDSFWHCTVCGFYDLCVKCGVQARATAEALKLCNNLKLQALQTAAATTTFGTAAVPVGDSKPLAQPTASTTTSGFGTAAVPVGDSKPLTQPTAATTTVKVPPDFYNAVFEDKAARAMCPSGHWRCRKKLTYIAGKKFPAQECCGLQGGSRRECCLNRELTWEFAQGFGCDGCGKKWCFGCHYELLQEQNQVRVCMCVSCCGLV
jgi:hypothetical protein